MNQSLLIIVLYFLSVMRIIYFAINLNNIDIGLKIYIYTGEHYLSFNPMSVPHPAFYFFMDVINSDVSLLLSLLCVWF